jgi:hypothetical protein
MHNLATFHRGVRCASGRLDADALFARHVGRSLGALPVAVLALGGEAEDAQATALPGWAPDRRGLTVLTIQPPARSWRSSR